MTICKKGVTKLGLGPLGGIIAIGVALVAMYYSMKFFGSLFGKENDNDWVGWENIGLYISLIIMIVVGFWLASILS